VPATDGTTPKTARAVLTRLIYDIVVGICKKDFDEKVISIQEYPNETCFGHLASRRFASMSTVPCLQYESLSPGDPLA
jgi:hypothetical protein